MTSQWHHFDPFAIGPTHRNPKVHRNGTYKPIRLYWGDEDITLHHGVGCRAYENHIYQRMRKETVDGTYILPGPSLYQ